MREAYCDVTIFSMEPTGLATAAGRAQSLATESRSDLETSSNRFCKCAALSGIFSARLVTSFGSVLRSKSSIFVDSPFPKTMSFQSPSRTARARNPGQPSREHAILVFPFRHTGQMFVPSQLAAASNLCCGAQKVGIQSVIWVGESTYRS